VSTKRWSSISDLTQIDENVPLNWRFSVKRFTRGATNRAEIDGAYRVVVSFLALPSSIFSTVLKTYGTDYPAEDVY